MTVVTYRPKIRLAELVTRLGGLSRDDAVEHAVQQLEASRSASDAVIEESIGALEAIARAAQVDGGYSPARMQEMLCLGDQIVTLAGTFGYENLDIASRSFCDVMDGLMRAHREDPASIHVHIQALRMMAPRGAALPQADAEKILLELAKILTHHGFDRLADSATGLEHF